MRRRCTHKVKYSPVKEQELTRAKCLEEPFWVIAKQDIIFQAKYGKIKRGSVYQVLRTLDGGPRDGMYYFVSHTHEGITIEWGCKAHEVIVTHDSAAWDKQERSKRKRMLELND